MDKKGKKYTFIPEGFEEEYESYKREAERKEAEKRYTDFSTKLDRKVSPFRRSSKRSDFIEKVPTTEIDHKKALERANAEKAKKRAEAINQQIMEYCKNKKVKLCKIYIKSNEVTIKIQNQDGSIDHKKLNIQDLNLDIHK